MRREITEQDRQILQEWVTRQLRRMLEKRIGKKVYWEDMIRWARSKDYLDEYREKYLRKGELK